MKNKIQYAILSPDGFNIGVKTHFSTDKLAWQNFDLWKKGYQKQGYYSTIKDGKRIKISIEDLKEHCELVTSTI